MGCSSSSVALVTSIESGDADSKPEQTGLFTVRQKIVISRTWAHLSDDPTGYGTKVFLYIFGTYPFIKTLFPVLADLEGDELVCNSNFKAHATRFMQAVDAVVENIDDPVGVMGPFLVGLGRQHVTFGGFKPEYFDAFEEAMTTVWAAELGAKFDEPARQAWTIVFQFIMQKLREGYELQMAESRK